MRYTHQVTMPVEAKAVDLPDWLFNLSGEDYAGCQKGHRAIGVVGDRAGMVNVESIGGSLLVQHYATRRAERHHVTMAAAASRAYLMHLVPVSIGVLWDMSLAPAGERSLFRCTIEVDMPAAVRLLGLFSATPFFVRRHLVEETRGFARDIVRKVDPGATATDIHDVAAGADELAARDATW